MTPVPAAAALGLDELRVSFEERCVLHLTSLSVERGEWLAVLGPNGSGKTTLLRAIAGAVPFTGTLSLGGRDAAALSPRERARVVAVVPQDPLFPEAMVVGDYVMLGRTPHIALFGFEGREDRRVVAELLARVELAGLAGRRIATLSGGERQRAVIARALAQEPSVLLLDEPTSALDIAYQHDLLGLVDDLRRERGMTVVSAVHDLTLAGQYADRFLLLHRGQALAAGGAADVLVPALLERCYGTPVDVIEHEGTLVVVPPRPRRIDERHAMPAKTDHSSAR